MLLAGDLNEGETGRAWRLFAAPLRLVSPTAPTYPAPAPRRLLDVVFASPDLAVLPHASVALDEADLVAASDHRPVWVDVDLDPQAVPLRGGGDRAGGQRGRSRGRAAGRSSARRGDGGTAGQPG